MESEQNKIFINKFNLKRYGFYKLTPFVDCNIGFSVLKKLNSNDNDNVTLLKIYIDPEILKTEDEKKLLSVGVAYGKKSKYGVTLRSFENIKLADPIDIECSDYFYNIKTEKLYKNNKEITGDKFINEVYSKHIESTKPIRGLLVRTKIKFWRTLMKSVYEFVFKFFYCILWLISGNRYSYEPFSEEEILNNRVIKSKYEEIKKQEREVKEELKESKKFDFFGYNASTWSIVFYSFLHLLIYTIFMYYDYKPIFITTILKNNFLTLVYVFFSLFIIEVAIPKFLMLLIKYFSKLSFNSKYKKIKL